MRGLMNVQFVLKGEVVCVLDVNPPLADRAVCQQNDEFESGYKAAQVMAAVSAIQTLGKNELKYRSLQSHFRGGG